MRVTIQRVSEASVEVNNQLVAEIDKGSLCASEFEIALAAKAIEYPPLGVFPILHLSDKFPFQRFLSSSFDEISSTKFSNEVFIKCKS